MKNIKSFSKMVLAESKMLVRNKALMIILLSMTIIILLLLSILSNVGNNIQIAFCYSGANLEETKVYQVLENSMNIANSYHVSTLDEGKELIYQGKVGFVVVIGDESSVDKATLYYDASNIMANSIKDRFWADQYKQAYKKVGEVLQQHGITIDDSYFRMVEMVPANANPPKWAQCIFGIGIAICVSSVLMFGIAYSTSRNFETAISKNLAYLPVGANRSLLSKLTPYLVLGLIQICAFLPLGMVLFSVTSSTNVLAVIALSSFFVSACISMGLMFGMAKSQITAILLDMSMIILPLLAILSSMTSGVPIILNVLLFMSPLYPYTFLLNGLLFNGVVVWKYVLILLLHTVGYYLVALIIYKRKARA